MNIESGNAWVQWVNARPRGVTEYRQVTLEVASKRGTREMKLRTVRVSDGEVARAVFCVMEPLALRNINYVVTEHRGKVEPFSIQLYLPYVFGTLRDVPSERRREGHFGSDFSYDDLRMWVYEDDHEYTVVESGPEIRVSGRCTGRSHLVRSGRDPFILRIDPETRFVRGIDYQTESGEPVREFRTNDVRRVDGYLIAGEMSIMDHSRDHSTTIRLERAWFDREVDVKLFDPEFRPRTREYLASL